MKDAILNGDTDDIHSHLMVGERTGSGWSHENDYTWVDPENFIKTKFDSNGNPISATDC